MRNSRCFVAVLAASVAIVTGIPLTGAPPSGMEGICGAPHGAQEAIFLHRQRMIREPAPAGRASESPGAVERVGEIAIIQATSEIVALPNPFDLAGQRISIVPAGSGFSVEVGAGEALVPIAEQGIALDLDDDDFATVLLPFEFPYYGEGYERLYVHSDGNLSFRYPEWSSTARNYSRAVGGPPRIAPFFRDLDPSKGGHVRVEVGSSQVVLGWDSVPLFTDFGIGAPQTFQVTLDESGGIEFEYGGITMADSIVGVFPGDAARRSMPVDWSAAPSVAFDEPVILAEVFRDSRSADEFAIAQAFYQSNEDAYDSLIVFDDLDFDTHPNSLAHAWTIRNEIEGIGETILDWAHFVGSSRRLSAFVNMQSLSEYPLNAVAPIPGLPHTSLLTVLAHEVGHRFLAYARFIDPETGEESSDLLGRGNAHWSFFFDSQASVLEGNSIKDHGAGASPRFETVAASQTYSPLDQYLMGIRAASDVPPMFYVKEPVASGRLGSAARQPEVGLSFDGVRKEVRVEDIVAAMGERRPAAAVAQRDFRYAFALVVPDGESPREESIQRLERLRSSWRAYFSAHLGSRATIATELVRMLHLSTWPAGGLVRGVPGRVLVTIAEPQTSDLTVNLDLDRPIADVPLTVAIPAGEVEAEFEIHGSEVGSTTLAAHTSVSGYDRAVTRLKVQSDLEGLKLEPLHAEAVQGVAGITLPLAYLVWDEDKVPYSGIELEFLVTGTEATLVGTGVTDANGEVEADWPIGPVPGTQVLVARIKGAPDAVALTRATAVAGLPEFDASAVVNAASGHGACPPPGDGDLAGTPSDAAGMSQPCTGSGFAPGSLVTIRGSNLATKAAKAKTLLLIERTSLPYWLEGVQVFVGGIATPLVSVAPDEITFQLPFEVQGPSLQVEVSTRYGRSDPVTVPLSAAQPAIYPDRVSTGARIATVVGTRPGSGSAARPGGILELFCTGLGTVSPPGRTGRAGTWQPFQRVVGKTEAWVDDEPVNVTRSGLAGFEAGLYTVLLTLPDDLVPGEHAVRIAVDGVGSNSAEFVSE